MELATRNGRRALGEFYRRTLLDDVVPFWLEHGLDREHGGFFTALARDGALLDDDKSIWFQGRAGWMFATLCLSVEPRAEWVDAARSAVAFLRAYGFGPEGKLYFTVARNGAPLRMRRYVYSEAFAAIAFAACSRLGDESGRDDAIRCFERYLAWSFDDGRMPAKVDPQTRPSIALGPRMIAIATAQELRMHLGEVAVHGRTLSEWIDWSIDEIERLFLKPEHQALMETVGPGGEILDHFDGRLLNPGHAIECAWFLLDEAARRNDRRILNLGLTILDWMWERGWDPEFGGFLYFRDLRGLPIQEYWHDMKFWWPHCEALIASLLAWRLTGEGRYADRHLQAHRWSFEHFPDPEFGEWYGYLHRDGRISTTLKGNMWKGPFHLPRMLWRCWRLLAETMNDDFPPPTLNAIRPGP